MDPIIEIVLSLSSGGGVTLAPFVYKWMRQKAKFRQEADEAKKLLGIQTSEGVVYRHASVHPLFSEIQIHPDNLAAITSVAGNEFRRAEANNLLSVVGSLKTDLKSNLELFGGPTSDGLTRITFGYRPDFGPDSLTLADAPVDLPYKWVLSRAQIDEHASVTHIVPGKGLVTRPNWWIEGPDRMFVPETDSEGFLSVDYLLVTRLRNYLDPQATGEGKFLISFGGTHGAAIRAVGLLLKDQEVLRQIAQRLSSRKPASYQILLRVGAMKHDLERGTRATKIEVVDEPIILPDRPEVWRTAHTIVKSELEKWAGVQQQQRA